MCRRLQWRYQGMGVVYFKDSYFKKVGVFHLICHVWLATRQELDEMVERDVIGG